MNHNHVKKILVIDGQGGKLGYQIISVIRENFSDVSILAVGTNSIATANMMKAKADIAATGENAVVHNAKVADIIVGPVGVVVADSFHGEITPIMATAIGQSPAHRILIPINKCNNYIVGVKSISLTKMIAAAVAEIARFI
ncbi:MAG: DUF3842 family protein [Erysipelothrix sp.]|jgi:hypothetical protein|nr:DUF3842 family protein [Erysipelothrix sp.]